MKASDPQRLKAFIEEKAKLCLHPPAGQLKYDYVTPTFSIAPGSDDQAAVPERSRTGHYLQMYDWDSCFFSQAAHRVGISGLARSVVANFLSLRHSDGYVPRTVSPQRIWDQGDHCKPFLAQALAKELALGGGAKQEQAAEFLRDLDDYLKYFQQHRRHESGLYHWRNVLESGVDDNLALLAPHEASKDTNEKVGDFPDSSLLAADLNGYLVAEFRAFAALAERAGAPALGDRYRSQADGLAALIEQKLWNERLGIHCNLDPSTGQQIEIRAWTGLVPALFDAAPPEQAEQVIRTNILSQEHFLRPKGLASVAASEPLYNQARRGLYGRAIVSNWQGPVWILPNALVVRCLIRHDLKKEASEISRRAIATLVEGLDATGTLYENYNADTGEALWAPQFMSWNVLALELIDLV